MSLCFDEFLSWDYDLTMRHTSSRRSCFRLSRAGSADGRTNRSPISIAWKFQRAPINLNTTGVANAQRARVSSTSSPFRPCNTQVVARNSAPNPLNHTSAPEMLSRHRHFWSSQCSFFRWQIISVANAFCGIYCAVLPRGVTLVPSHELCPCQLE